MMRMTFAAAFLATGTLGAAARAQMSLTAKHPQGGFWATGRAGRI